MSSLRRIAPILAVGAAGLALAACGGGNEGAVPGTTTLPPVTTVVTEPGHVAVPPSQRKPLDPKKTYKVVVRTNQGPFTITLDQKTSPQAAASFVSLAQSGFFDGTIFHRIVPGFVIQGGDPTASGTGGPGYSTRDRVPQDAAYDPGVVAMAKAGNEPPGTAGSQFFVVTGAGAGLTPDYALLGRVTKGMSVVQEIAQLGDPASGGAGTPLQSVAIEETTVRER
jgi:peptidyl-prolyl cis-trans isomerase B (cyclophilin B)